MRRVCDALRWLAVVALAVGLFSDFNLVHNMSMQTNTGVEISTGGSTWPLIVRMTSMLTSELPAIVDSVAFALGASAVGVGVVVAWASRLRRWFAALVILEVFALFAPYVINAWLFERFSPSPPTTAVPDYTMIAIVISSVIPLIPVALTLVVARAARKAAADPAPGAMAHPDDATTDADAALEITRSRL